MPNLKIRLKLRGTLQSRSDERQFIKQVESLVPAAIANLLRDYPGQVTVEDIVIRGPYGDKDDSTPE